MPDVNISQQARVTITQEAADADFSQQARVAVISLPADADFSQVVRIAVVKNFVAGSQSGNRIYTVV